MGVGYQESSERSRPGATPSHQDSQHPVNTLGGCWRWGGGWYSGGGILGNGVVIL